MPFYSIIIPTFNGEKDIAACCLSIINQTFQDYEIIVQDGHSTDGTLAEVAKLKRQFPLISLQIVSEKDSGIYDAMNKAIGHALGDWLLFLGSDDKLYDKDVLKSVFDLLQNTAARVVYGNAELVGGSVWAKDTLIYDGPFSLEKLFSKNICHQAIFYNRSVFNDVGYFNTRYRVCADWDFNFRCFAKTRVQYIDRIVATFAGGGLSNTGADTFKEESIMNLKNYFGINYYNRLFKTYSWVFLHQSIVAFKNRSFLRSLDYLVLSFFHAGDKWLLFKIVLRKLFHL